MRQTDTQQARPSVSDRAQANWCLLQSKHIHVKRLHNSNMRVSTRTAPAVPAGDFQLRPAAATALTTADVQALLGRPDRTLVDARAAARFRGETEPLDPVAGHIPGALNRPFSDNLLPDGRFKPAEVLRAEFDRLLAGRDPAGVVHQCGSGVSAVPNLLAMELAGLGRAPLYPGSWSAWCNTPGTARAQG